MERIGRDLGDGVAPLWSEIIDLAPIAGGAFKGTRSTDTEVPGELDVAPVRESDRCEGV